MEDPPSARDAKTEGTAPPNASTSPEPLLRFDALLTSALIAFVGTLILGLVALTLVMWR